MVNGERRARASFNTINIQPKWLSGGTMQRQLAIDIALAHDQEKDDALIICITIQRSG